VNRSAGNPLPDEPWPLSARNLLSKRENKLYQNLIVLYPDHKIFVQVALSQLIDVDRNHPESDSIRARYKQLVADFVLCRADLSVVAVIELDDRTHEWPKRKAADARKNKALADAGIRLVRVPAGRLPTTEKLRELLDADRPVGDRTDIPTLHAPEPELRLVEEVDDPSLAIAMDRTESESRVFKEITRKIILGGVLIVAGWFVYSQFLGFANQPAFQPMTVRSNASSVAHAVPLITPTATRFTAPVTVNASANELAMQKQQALQVANAVQKKKDTAWAAFYSAPASCEHPPSWKDQVECGNLHMRAKKRFEEQWATSQGTAAEVVLGNGSVGGPHK
jgi:uncharacterized protein DUF2726